MDDMFEDWKIWGKHVILTMKRFEERFDKNEEEGDKLKDEMRKEFNVIKDLINTKVQGLSHEFNQCKLEQSNDLTALKTKISIYAAAFGGGISLFFTVILPWLAKALGFSV